MEQRLQIIHLRDLIAATKDIDTLSTKHFVIYVSFL